MEAVAYVATLPTPANASGNVRNAAHILDHFDIPNAADGECSGIKAQGSFEPTYWSAISGLSSQLRCYFRTYDNPQLHHVELKDFDINAKAPPYLLTAQPSRRST